MYLRINNEGNQLCTYLLLPRWSYKFYQKFFSTITTYNVTIISPLGWLSRKETTSRKELADLRKEAQKNAYDVDFNKFPKTATHLVYYYELGNKVKVLMQPELVDDETFYRFVDNYKPEYVGARHRI